ncbi:hypothetical protein [Bordetella genomosp. 11]|uniref:HNH endonuclease n=1 Tax=Bordetella genomosp. 11 TaxID=1416808 RepID=A0A261UIZ6_9BORD|nr:hypothetical protein [Bordetella genomosp. 11]OZI61591.1 hypothetical protein CAL28_20120 [Bordetella genomosp. 11]
MSTADKPDLPPRLVASFDNEAEMVVLYADHVRAVLEARADERRKTLDKAAQVADGFRCGACGMDGKAGSAIRALIDKQPTT